MNKLIIPKVVKEVLETFIKNGYQAYIVGGAVRDYCLGKIPSDYDITTSATTDEIKETFKDDKVFEVALRHGTVILRRKGVDIEITTFRGSDKSSLAEDLLKRDFTINSLAYSLDNKLIDLTNGKKDIEEKIIRLNGNDDTSFLEDPLRILRALRFKVTLGFEIDKQTKEYIKKNYNLLSRVSKERINDEFSKIIVAPKAYEIIKEYLEVFSIIIPNLKSLENFKQNNPYHCFDCLDHTLTALKVVEPKTLRLTLATLLHDIAKPLCYTESNGRGHFYGHQEKSVEIANVVLRSLRYSNKLIKEILTLIKYHDYDLNISNKSIIKLIGYIGVDLVYDLYSLKEADIQAQSPTYISRLEDIKNIREKTKSLIENNQCFSITDLKISGTDLLDMGYQSGTKIGQILKTIYNLVLACKLENNREELLEYIHEKYKIKSKQKD